MLLRNNFYFKNKKSLQKSPSHGNPQPGQEETAGNQKDVSKKSSVPLKRVRAPESIPDDTSFIASLKERQKESEVNIINPISHGL